MSLTLFLQVLEATSLQKFLRVFTLLKHISCIVKQNSDYHDLTISELREAFQSLKSNKASGLDEINVNIVKRVFDIIESPLFHILDMSIKYGTFPNHMKIARVIPVFKSGDSSITSNYRPISILPCFSKILERIMYNRLYNYLTTNNILYNKQFGFQKQHSTEHAIVQLTNEISNSFENNLLTLGVFIDLSKAFDTVDHKILISKLNHYGIKGKTLTWFRDYLKYRSQCVSLVSDNSDFKEINCGVPQGSILGPLLFLLYINDIYNSSENLKFVLFADDTNLFYSHHDVHTLFNTVNQELKQLEDWFKANRLSLNVDKTKYTLFHKTSQADNLPLKLPNLTINGKIINRENSIKFLGVVLDQHISWNEHIRIVENKISKNIGLLCKAKYLLDLHSLKSIYYTFIHSYINYANIVWGSTFHSKIKNIHRKQKLAGRIICNVDRHTSGEPIMHKLGILNVFKLNIFQTLVFMFKVRKGMSPKVFIDEFKKINHKYPTRHSKDCFSLPKIKSSFGKFSMSYRGPYLWNSFVKQHSVLRDEKTSLESFKVLTKRIILRIQNDLHYY